MGKCISFAIQQFELSFTTHNWHCINYVEMRKSEINKVHRKSTCNEGKIDLLIYIHMLLNPTFELHLKSIQITDMTDFCLNPVSKIFSLAQRITEPAMRIIWWLRIWRNMLFLLGPTRGLDKMISWRRT